MRRMLPLKFVLTADPWRAEGKGTYSQLSLGMRIYMRTIPILGRNVADGMWS